MRWFVQIEFEVTSRRRWPSAQAMAKSIKDTWCVVSGSGSLLDEGEYHSVTYHKPSVRVKELKRED